jgi:pimeloyl-ACP methyl ester carboxylesterase
MTEPATGVDAEHVIRLADGRDLSWAECGASGGRPVLTLHGSPGSRLSRHAYPEQLVAAGIRQITFDRPGYGLSTPRPGRSVADVVTDVEAVLDAAGLDQVGVIGGSGGGPHALAVAALLAHRCTVVHCIVGVAPYGAPGLDFFAGMDPENQRRFRAALRGRDAAIEEFTADFAAMRERITDDPVTIMGNMDLPDADREILRRLGQHVFTALAEAVRQGATGMADDFVAIASDWQFDPREVRAPVLIAYGEHDVNVPAGHGRWLADNVPHRGVRVNADGGHLASPEAGLALLTEVAEMHSR